MNIGTFNGSPVLQFPLAPGIATAEFTFSDTVSENVSSFTQQTQQYIWPGGDLIMGTLTFPPMPRAKAAALVAFVAECRGKSAMFLVGDSAAKHPLGNPQGLPVVAGAQTAMAATLCTRGWHPNASRLLLPGDYIQIGAPPAKPGAFPTSVRLHVVLDTVSTDAQGNATLTLWPSLREPVADGTAIVTHNCKGLFRLADNKRVFNISNARIYSSSFAIVEAR